MCSDCHEAAEVTADKVRISVHSCHIILSEDLKIHHVFQHIIPRTLMQEQCNNHMRMNVELINAAHTKMYM
jgi:hypothetical protein